MLSVLLIIIPLLSQYQVLCSPTLLWSNAELPKSAIPISKLSSLNVISDYICKLHSSQVQVRLFTVNELTNEDIQRGSQKNHPVLVDARNENTQFRYFPDVTDDAHKTFSLMPQSNNLKCAQIHFEITSSNKYETLEDALNAIQESINAVNKNSNTVVVMALIHDPLEDDVSVRKRRDVDGTKINSAVLQNTSCLFYASQLYMSDDQGQQSATKNYTLDLSNSSCVGNSGSASDVNASSVILDLRWTREVTEIIDMKLIINITNLYWRIYQAIINGSEYRYFAYGMPSDMETPPTFSYVCTSAMFVKYDPSSRYGSYSFKDKVFISNLQFQPFAGVNGSWFGSPNYCTSFFTSGIWMGITSSLVCLGILLFGVHRMMSIKANDQFDDPKGKPLVIKAQE